MSFRQRVLGQGRNFNESCGSQRGPWRGGREEEEEGTKQGRRKERKKRKERRKRKPAEKALLSFHRVAAMAPRTPLA